MYASRWQLLTASPVFNRLRLRHDDQIQAVHQCGTAFRAEDCSFTSDIIWLEESSGPPSHKRYRKLPNIGEVFKCQTQTQRRATQSRDLGVQTNSLLQSGHVGPVTCLCISKSGSFCIDHQTQTLWICENLVPQRPVRSLSIQWSDRQRLLGQSNLLSLSREVGTTWGSIVSMSFHCRVETWVKVIIWDVSQSAQWLWATMFQKFLLFFGIRKRWQIATASNAWIRQIINGLCRMDNSQARPWLQARLRYQNSKVSKKPF